jgi:hypothetical protein
MLLDFFIVLEICAIQIEMVAFRLFCTNANATDNIPTNVPLSRAMDINNTAS